MTAYGTAVANARAPFRGSAPLLHPRIAIGIFIYLILAVPPASARVGEGGGFGAASSLFGPAGWIGSGRTLTIDSVSALYQGPAALSRHAGTALSATYSRPFSELDGLDLGSFDGATTWRSYAIGASYNHFEIGGLREATAAGALTGRQFEARHQRGSLTVARPWLERFGVGASVHYENISIMDRSQGRFGLDLGGEFLSEKWRANLSVRNLAADRSGPDATPILGEARLEYKPWKQLHLGGAVTYEEEAGSDFRMGVKYDFWGPVSLLAGYVNETEQWSGGGIFRYRNINFQYGVTFHKDLEATHVGTMGVEF